MGLYKVEKFLSKWCSLPMLVRDSVIVLHFCTMEVGSKHACCTFIPLEVA